MNKILLPENFMNIWDFMVYKRTDLDEQGTQYPILYMNREVNE